MERDAEEPDNNEPSNLWSGSDASQEHCVSESFADSYYEDDASDAEYRLDPLPVHVESEVKSPELYQNEEWKPTGEQQQPPGFNGSEEEVSYQGEDEEDFFLSDSRESLPHVQTSPPVSPRLQRPDSEPKAGKMSLTRSSSLSTDGAADATLALTPTRGQPQKASNRRCPGTLNMGVDSSEEGGSHEAPPASVFFGMPDEGAEPAETWNSESDTDLCRPDTQGLRNTRTGHNESQSERQAKENKSKCKKIARLLTNAPNPHNKGALLFNKRRQRVEKYTLVSYGTGDNRHGGQEQLEEELEESGSAGYDFVETTDSEIEEEYCVHHQQQNFSPNWGSLRDMEALPDTSGKGVLMFAKCRKRVDEIASEQEQLRNKGMEKLFGPTRTEAQNIYDAQQLYYPADDVDVNIGQQGAYQDVFQQINHPSSNMSRGLVSNRTAKPFPGFQDSGPAPFISGGAGPPTKKQERKFKVPVLTNTNPQVWSPTGDIIASRDERISVPAIKTGILPESKRRAGSKQASLLGQDKQNKGDGRSCVDAEEDCFSLGAEACNFMQPRRIKLRNPPPVAPKPAMNPACPPVMRRSPLSEPYIPQRSPVSQPCQTYARPHSQQHLQQRDWDPSRNSHSGPGGAQAMPHTPAKTHSPQPLLPPARKNRSQQPQQSTLFRPPQESPLHLQCQQAPRVFLPTTLPDQRG
ncbi:synaptopodin-2 isoform X3 [Takifugu flavidus]|uniref:synaptopodin-2 isoform X3 n=1 Tax=Takifugu flavidus TaxID=433684 RepID=UPI0025442E47|nr:synaptopodin-2 isoform X3 [Takifugu flavidus]